MPAGAKDPRIVLGERVNALRVALGLSQEEKLVAGANAAYRRALDRSFLPRLLFRLEGQIQSGFQRPEFLLDHGVLDQICDRRELRERIAHLVALLMKLPAPEDEAAEA